MNVPFLKLKIIDVNVKRVKLLNSLSSILILFFVSLLISLYVYENVPKVKYSELAPYESLWYTFLISVMVLMYILGRLIHRKGYMEETGDLYIYPHELYIENGDIKQYFHMSKLSKLSVTYNTYAYRNDLLDIIKAGARRGINNRVCFDFEGKSYKFTFLSKDRKDMSKIARMLAFSRRLGFNYGVKLKGHKNLI